MKCFNVWLLRGWCCWFGYGFMCWRWWIIWRYVRLLSCLSVCWGRILSLSLIVLDVCDYGKVLLLIECVWLVILICVMGERVVLRFLMVINVILWWWLMCYLFCVWRWGWLMFLSKRLCFCWLFCFMFLVNLSCFILIVVFLFMLRLLGLIVLGWRFFVGYGEIMGYLIVLVSVIFGLIFDDVWLYV